MTHAHGPTSESFSTSAAPVPAPVPRAAGPMAETASDGADEWLLIVDQVCHGIHHALNNRIGSLSALLELTRLGDLPPNDPAFASLSAELTRLEECARTVRLLPRASMGEEPLIIDDVLADVLAVHVFLHDLRETPLSLSPTRFVEPVRAERWALVRALVLMLADAKRLAKANRASVKSSVESDERWVRVAFRVEPVPVGEVPAPARSAYAEALARVVGGAITREEGRIELRLPTLKTRRADRSG